MKVGTYQRSNDRTLPLSRWTTIYLCVPSVYHSLAHILTRRHTIYNVRTRGWVRGKSIIAVEQSTRLENMSRLLTCGPIENERRTITIILTSGCNSMVSMSERNLQDGCDTNLRGTPLWVVVMFEYKHNDN